MKGFFKTFFAALLAFIVGNIVFIFFAIVMLVWIGTSLLTKPTASITSNSVLRINFAQPITDNPVANPISVFNVIYGGASQSLSLYDVLNAIENAARDVNIKGIYLNPSPNGSVNISNAEEIRESLLKFKESGKFIISYADVYSQSVYYVCSVADEMYVNPEGGLMWLGLSSTVMYYKGLFDKLDLDAEIIRHGDYKSAVEPFFREDMSPENREQLEALTGSIWEHIIAGVSSDRGIEAKLLNQYASELSVINSEDAVNKGMFDGVSYFGDVETMLADMAGSRKRVNMVPLTDYIIASTPMPKGAGRDKVAIIYAEGDIVDGDSYRRGYIVSSAMAQELAKAREDDNIKAVVVRINSPGGSALAAEVIWKEMNELRKKKPLIVSMGSMAASGGYYMAAPADIIVANRSTLTGSIGVFGVLIKGERMLRNKLGLTFDVAKTNPSADMSSSLLGLGLRPLSDLERRKMEEEIERVYSTFVNRVAEGRNMSYDEVNSVAGGRVWSGANAVDVGLADGYGGLLHAIEVAADRAGIQNDYDIVSPSTPTDKLEWIMEFISAKVRNDRPDELMEVFREYQHLKGILSRQGVQAVIPYIPEMQ